MPVATLAETLGIAGAVVGILTGVIGTVIALLSYRRQAVAVRAQQATPAPAPGPSAAVYASTGRQSPLRRISLKAGVSALLGIVATFYAGLLSLAASLGEDPAAIAEGTAVAFGLAAVAVVVGFLARGDIRRNPERRGKLMYGTGIATAVMACLIAFGAMEQDPATTTTGLTDVSQLTSVSGSIDQLIDESGTVGSGDVAAAAEAQIAPQLQQQLQAQFLDPGVTVESIDCKAAGAGGTCTTLVADSLGNRIQPNLGFAFLDPLNPSSVVWQVE